MAFKVVADSSSNLFSLKDTDFTSVPLTIVAGNQEFVDNRDLDVPDMLGKLASYSGKTSTACPGLGEWLDAFEGSDQVIAIALTSRLSGGYASAVAAADIYMSDNEGTEVCVLDTLTTGPELELLAEKAAELQKEELPFASICQQMKAYMKRTHLAFSLESLSNFVKNGRVSPALAKLVEFLDIHIVGRASEVGDLEPMNKCKGTSRSMQQIFTNMESMGYRGGKVRIRHTLNPEASNLLKDLIVKVYPNADVTVAPNRGLCAYYAEKGGILVGFEG